MCPVLGRQLTGRLLFGWTAASIVLAQQLVVPDSPSGRHFAEVFDRNWEHPTGTPLRCSVLHSAAQLEFNQDYGSVYSFAVPMAQINPEIPRDFAVVFRVTTIEPASQHAYFFVETGKLPDTVSGFEVPGKTEATGEGMLNYGAGRYRVDWLLQLQSGQTCRHTWSLRTGPPPEIRGRLAPGEVTSVDYTKWPGFASIRSRTPRRATVLLHAVPRGSLRNRVHIAPDEIATLMGSLQTVLNSGHYDSARVVVFQFYRTRIVFEIDSIDPTGFRRVADALGAVDIGTVDVSTLLRANTRDDFLSGLLLREAQLKTPSQDVYFVGFTRAFADSWDVQWPARAALPFRLSYLAITPGFRPAHDAVSQLVHKAGGRVVAIYEPRQLGKFLRAMAGAPGR